MSWLSRSALALFLAACCGLAAAQGNSPAPAVPEPTLPALRSQFEAIPRQVKTNEDLRDQLARTSEVVTQAGIFVDARTGQLADLNAQLGELGEAPAKGGSEDPDVTRQRSTLQKERNALDADIRLARLLAVDAQQRGNELRTQRRALFEAQLLDRADSPLGPAFWRALRAAWPTDVGRLEALADEVKKGLASAVRGSQSETVFVALAGALVLMLFGHRLAERLIVRLAARFFPVGRLRRSLLALAVVSANVLITALAVAWVWQTLQNAGTWGPTALKLGSWCADFALFLAFLVGLGRALLANGRTSWRLPPIADDTARRIAAFPWLAAALTVVIWVPIQINTIVDASFAAVVATHVVTALAPTLLAAVMLWQLRAPKPAPVADEPAPDGPAKGSGEVAALDAAPAIPPWVSLLVGGVALVLVAICVLVAIGYVALSSFIASQLTWACIVATAAYLLFKFADDLFMALFSSRSRSGQRLQTSFRLSPQTLDQVAVILSGLSRLAIFFYMLLAIMAPLGTNPEELFERSGQFGSGLKIGEFELVPGAIVGALSVLLIGLVALQLFKRWLDNTYLPSTALEPGMRSSITTLLGYAGSILVVAFALSALGIGVNRIAWIASALSVGIGFGLQAIVQNFISGLILLAERPVKVGDWVVLGTAEGDVRRINVRATEIQLGDRSTLIVPNSEFITKTVRNMTLTNAEGRVLVRLPMPLTTDAQRARDVMLTACAGHAGVLPTPAPAVTLEGIENGFLIFQLIAYVQSPRAAGGVRSDLLFTILDGLNTAQLPLAAYAAAPAPAGPMAPMDPTAPPIPPTPPAASA
ncbi:MAG: mechanosensitive ion channel family protein [Variovorax sp.]|nr:MAG: mechanosensitive ion channel family protein [Variovorax sp.]